MVPSAPNHRTHIITHHRTHQSTDQIINLTSPFSEWSSDHFIRVVRHRHTVHNILNPQSSILNPQSSILNPQSSQSRGNSCGQVWSIQSYYPMPQSRGNTSVQRYDYPLPQSSSLKPKNRANRQR